MNHIKLDKDVLSHNTIIFTLELPGNIFCIEELLTKLDNKILIID